MCEECGGSFVGGDEAEVVAHGDSIDDGSGISSIDEEIVRSICACVGRKLVRGDLVRFLMTRGGEEAPL
jgi:hypothetical protein